ncbi:GNAT family N-acetyltransferase [Azospirillum soli]|uniref:GNAT family N-acetyltransferase n=1 Tax=Azospirillum soli TaxID=1304799 RepID=UPI001AE2BF78|nr:GNAT family N-acetyltransferase [Azospirillum soli]MBP2312587.1 ribosomal protein S18 acetylase RimI-like enzyme [Azospirillum soli]
MPEPPTLGRATLTVEMVIRLCAEADLPALEWMGLFSPHRAVIRDAFEAQQRGDGLMLLALTAGFPVGQVWIDLARKRGEGTAVLWAVRTFPPLQGAGIGRHLMTAAERILRERGIHRAELGVERANEGARRFYERLGWREAGTLRETFRFTDPEGRILEEPLDQWRMVKDLDG